MIISTHLATLLLWVSFLPEKLQALVDAVLLCFA